jgi:hypothetical protein
MDWKSRIAHTIGKFLNPDEGGSNEQFLPSVQRELIQSRESVSRLNKDTDSMVVKQILSKNPSFFHSAVQKTLNRIIGLRVSSTLLPARS